MCVHWVGDFVLQTRWQAKHKSTNNTALLQHVTVYMIAVAAGSALIFGISGAWVWFVYANAAAHFITDYFTSRQTTRLFTKHDWHNGFVVVGFDQLIHQGVFVLTMWGCFYA